MTNLMNSKRNGVLESVNNEINNHNFTNNNPFGVAGRMLAKKCEQNQTKFTNMKPLRGSYC